MALNTRTRGRIGALAAAALAFGGIVAAASATADASVDSTGSLAWGFKKSFRSYVGLQTAATPPIGPLPVGERIEVLAPAQFDASAEPAAPSNTSSPNETLPYLLPVAAASVTDSQNLRIATAGGATFNFPSHFFTVSFSDAEVIVEDGDARLVADLDIVVTGSFNEFEPGEYHVDDVHVADVATVDVTEAGDVVTVSGSGLTLTSEAAAFLPYAAGDALDDFSVSVLAKPDVEISEMYFDAEGASTVTVTGRGFYHGNATGTRPPLAGKPSGAYVVVGYFADVWRPSAGAAGTTRPAVEVADGGQKWAVPAESIPAPISPASGGIVLAPDGSFTTELTIDKSIIDEAAEGKVSEGNYGIYTYPGSGAKVPGFETYTPIEFVTEPTVVSGPADVAAVDGATVSFLADVSGGGISFQWQSKAEAGDWRDIDGAHESQLTLKAVYEDDGTQYRVVASNVTGSVTTEAATLTVALPAPVVTGPANAVAEVGTMARFSADVAGRLVALQWQSRTGAGAWTDIAGATAATLEVAARSVSQSGTQYRVVASNAGGAVESAAATLTVTKAAAKVTVTAKKSFRFASKAKATVTVDAPEGVAASGAVVIKAGKKTVGKGTVRNGSATVTLNKKLLPGTRNLVAQYAGNAEVGAASSAAAKVTVKKAAAKITAKLAKKSVKTGKRAVLRVKVTGSNVKPGGKVKITIREGKKTVRTLTVRVKGGKVTKARLPKLGKGTYQVRALYQGTKKVAKKSASKVVLRVR